MTTFDDIRHDIPNLGQPELAALLAELMALEGLVLARLLAGPSTPVTEDRLLTVEEAAAMLAVSPQWLYRRGKRLGLAVKLGDGTLRYSSATIQRFIRDRSAEAPHRGASKRAVSIHSLP